MKYSAGASLRSRPFQIVAKAARLLPLFLLCLLSHRAFADGFPLPLQNAGTWGPSPAQLIADIRRALEDSGFLDAVKVGGDLAKQIGQGKVPAIDDLTGVIEGDVQRRVDAAVAQATDATQLLAMLDVTTLQQLFTTLQTAVTTPQEFAFSIPGGRLVFRRDLFDVSLCAMIAGPGGARVTLGMSNGKQLCGNPAERFVNPTREPVLFADFALGYSNLQARRRLLAPPVPGPDPNVSIQAATYFEIHDDWVQLRLAGNDPQSLSLKLEFVVGVKAGVSAEIQAEVEGQVILELGVKPTQVAALLFDIGDILKRRLGNGSHASLEAAPALAADAFREVFAYLRTVEGQGEELGELAIRLAGDGAVGVGIWDTGINGASVGAEVTLSVPLEAMVSLQGDLLARQFEAGLEASTQLISLFETMSEGRLTEQELLRQRELIGRTAQRLALGIVSSYADYIQDIGLRYEMGIYALGDIGQVADQTIPLIILGADIPVGKILVKGVNGIPQFVSGVTETAKALVWTAEMAISAGLDAGDRLSLGEIVPPRANAGGYVQRPRGNPPTPPTPAEWEAMAATLLDDVTFSVQLGIIEVEGVSLGNWVRLAGSAHEVTTSLLSGAVRSAVVANEKPLLDALRAAPGRIGNEAKDLLIFNLQNLSIGISGSLGASGTIGAEVAVGVGASIGFEAQLKTSLILLALDHEGYDEEDGTLLAGIDIPVEVSASAGVALAEGLEVTAEGGVTAGSSLANLTLKDWGQDLPVPAGLTVAGFEVIDFVGTNRQDGTIKGSGWIVLPMGGLVRADQFSLDNKGQVLDGRWSGVFEMGPLGEVPIGTGTISNDGLLGSGVFHLGLSRLNANWVLRSDGLLLGRAVGRLNFAGLDLDADLRLDAAGFVGSGKTRILGSEFSSTNFRVHPNGSLAGSFSGTLAVDGQLLTLQKLEIEDQKLRGRTTIDLAGHRAVEVLLTVDEGGVIGTFVSDLDLFGAGKADAWLRITDQIEVFGEMDGDFMESLATLLRGQLLAGVSDAQQTLRREQQKLRAFQAEIEESDRKLAELEQEIKGERKAARELLVAELARADQKVRDANAELDKAINELIKVSGQFAAELEKAERDFRAAELVFDAARREVNKLRGQIAALDGWYNSLDAAGRFFKAVEYGIRRAPLMIALGVAEPAFAVAQRGYDTAFGVLQAVQNKLVNADELRAIKAAKEEAFRKATADADKIRRDLEAISDDPTLDPRHIALSIGREVAIQLAQAAESVVALTIGALGEVAGLVDYLNRNPESALVKIEKVNFRSQLAALNQGDAELIVEAVIAGRPQRMVFSYNFKLGDTPENIAAAVRRLPPGLYPDPAWTVSPWTNDASSGLTPGLTAWAYHFNSDATANVGSVPVLGLIGTSPAVTGRFSVEGFFATYPGDQNALTSGTGGSSIIAANFLYGANPGTVTFEGLTAGISYRATFLSVGWDEAPTTRSINFSSGTNRLTVSQNTYGNDRGIRIDHTFTATGATHTVTLTPATDATFHLYALALSVEGDSPLTFADWKQTEFGANSFNPGIAGDKADPDGDDVPNILEYSLRSNPRAANRPGLAPAVPITLPGAIEARRFTFPYQATSGDLIYRLQYSTDLRTWTDAYRINLATGSTAQFSGASGLTDAETQTVTVTITDLTLFNTIAFWRLGVERP